MLVLSGRRAKKPIHDGSQKNELNGYESCSVFLALGGEGNSIEKLPASDLKVSHESEAWLSACAAVKANRQIKNQGNLELSNKFIVPFPFGTSKSTLTLLRRACI